jgi:ABC-type transport system involved in cytochrome bd biosynthesis fused ATPase/permease subunit
MILYMRAYMETGKVGRDEVNLTRSAPLSFFESFAQMTKFSLMIPCTFFVALIPRSLFMINQVSVMSWAVGRFTAGVMAADRAVMIQGFSVMIASNVAIPILGFLQNTVESRYSSRLVDRCRRKMLASTVKGGTAFDEAYPSGRLVDAFSNHLAQLEIYTQYQFVTFFPQLVALISGMITVARAYAFAAILFVSLIPVIVSVDFFTKRATAASNKKGHNDGHFMGKVASAVECRRAIRAGNAGTWVEDDMEDLLSSTYETHRASFFSSTLVENFTQSGGSFYTVVVLIPVS